MLELLVVHRTRCHRAIRAGRLHHLQRLGLHARMRLAKSRRDDGHAQFVAQCIVVHGARDHGRRFRGKRLDHVHHVVHLLQLKQRFARRDIDQHAARIGNVDVFEQRTRDSLLRRHARAIGAGGLRRTHHRHAGFGHHGLHIREIDVDHAGTADDLRDTGDRAMQHVVGGAKRFVERHLVAEHLHQLVVRDHDQRIHVLRQRFQALLRDSLPLALERERLGNHGNREDAEFARDFRHYRRRPGAGAAAHARCQEQHVRTADQVDDALAVFQRRVTSDLRIGTGTQSLGDFRAQLQLRARLRALQRLHVRIGADELHAFDPVRDHVVDRVAPAAAHADHLDYRFLRRNFHDFKHSCLL